jgi:hypothetical protein
MEKSGADEKSIKNSEAKSISVTINFGRESFNPGFS